MNVSLCGRKDFLLASKLHNQNVYCKDGQDGRLSACSWMADDRVLVSADFYDFF
jgi:hypothetical protein